MIYKKVEFNHEVRKIVRRVFSLCCTAISVLLLTGCDPTAGSTVYEVIYPSGCTRDCYTRDEKFPIEGSSCSLQWEEADDYRKTHDYDMRILDEKQQVKTWVYDQTNDTMVQLHDLLDEDALDDVSEITKAYFKKQYPEECDTQNFAIFTAPAYDNFETFVLRKDAFVFYFAAGTLFDRGVYMELPYEQLQDHIRMEPEQVTAFVPYADVLNEPVKQIDPNKPMVALTFDDGPTKKYTTAILDALKEHQASATFFVLGSRAKDFPEILQRMVLEGNEVGNHTFSHKQLTTLSKENIEEEITATQESIHDVINRYPTIIRPPYGSKNDNVLSCAQGKKIVTIS